MCGLAGFVDFNGHPTGAAQLLIRRMTAQLAHRGPDGAGHHVDRWAALGHRRLAIIDREGGQQPMAGADGRLQLVFNGEIYNFQTLRRELAARGHRFRTRGDTEVILASFLEWGTGCVERLEGMFAFALWDQRERQLLLARDRLGKKPLYYHHRGSRIAFASELKALRADPEFPLDVDVQSLDCYFTFGYVPSPATIHAGVNKLRPAHSLHVTADGVAERRYWQLRMGQVRTRSLGQATEEFESLLDEAVRCRMISDVPLGAFLSGGLDSGLVLASMTKASRQPVNSNSIGFAPREASELPAAAEIAAFLGTGHHEFLVQADLAEVLPRLAWHLDEPLADSSVVPTWYVCAMARQQVVVALSGDGGDESFAGYTFRYLPHMAESRLRHALPALLRGPLFGALGALWPASARLPRALRLRTVLQNLALGDAQAYCRDLAWLGDGTRQTLYTPDFRQALLGFTPMEAVYPFYARSDGPDALARAQHADLQFYLPEDVLVKVDRMSMAHGLEVRSPLLDHRIVEFAATLPAGLKIDGLHGKRVPRALAACRLPPSVLERPKRGFDIPAARWLREGLRPLIEDVLSDSRRPLHGLLDAGRLRRMWQEHLSGARDHHVFLWGLLMLGLWQDSLRKPGAAASDPAAEVLALQP